MGRTKVNIEDVYWGGNDNPTPFVTSIPIPVNGSNEGDLNGVLQVGSYSINVDCYNVPNEGCGNNTNSNTTAVPVSGALNVFMSGDALFQQLFWEYSSGTILNQYQRVRTLNGSNYVWSDWKKLIKCDDYATNTEVGGIKIGFTPANNGVIPLQLDANHKAYIELLAKNIRYAISHDNIIPGNKYWLKNKTIIIPDGSAEIGGYNEGLRIANTPQKYSLLALGTDNGAAGLNNKQWNILKHPTGELTISFDNGFITDIDGNIIGKTGLTLYNDEDGDGDIYWKNTKLNLPRATPNVNGWLHADDFARFRRTADHAQITLRSGKLEFSDKQNYIGWDEIFVNGNDSPDFDDYRLYDGDGSYNLVAGRRYEVIINMGMSTSTPAGGGLITLQLEETGGQIIKSTPMTANTGYFTMSLSCIVDGGIPISVSIQKAANMTLTLEQYQCWFAVHEIK